MTGFDARAAARDALLAGLVALLFFASLLIGPAALGLGESLSALFRGEGGPVVLVMQEIRLPRADAQDILSSLENAGEPAMQKVA